MQAPSSETACNRNHCSHTIVLSQLRLQRNTRVIDTVHPTRVINSLSSHDTVQSFSSETAATVTTATTRFYSQCLPCDNLSRWCSHLRLTRRSSALSPLVFQPAAVTTQHMSRSHCTHPTLTRALHITTIHRHGAVVQLRDGCNRNLCNHTTVLSAHTRH